MIKRDYSYLFRLVLLALLFDQGSSVQYVHRNGGVNADKSQELPSAASVYQAVAKARSARFNEPEDNHISDEHIPTVDSEEPASARPYKHPGYWATPAPESGIDLGFTPVQTYLQVRRTSSVQRLPRSEAIKEAASLDEVLNAHRLKEVLRTKKIQEVYSEEGYEDSAYDHGNHERHAEHDEGFSKHRAGKYKLKEPAQHLSDTADSESKVVESKEKSRNKKPKYSRKRVETTSMKFAYMDDGKGKGKKQSNGRPTRSQSPLKHKRTTKVSKELKEKTPAKRDFVSEKEDFWNFPDSFEKLNVNKWGANFEPMTSRKEKVTDENTGANNRIRIPPVPTFGYIHSLTDAHYGNQAPMVYHQPKPISSHVINLTEAFRPSPRTMYQGFEAKKLNKRIKRNLEEGERYKNTEEYEKELTKSLDEQEKNIIRSSLKNLGAINDVTGNFPFLRPSASQSFKPINPWKRPGFDAEKYPYYNARGIDPYSPLRYASHPREFPIKSGEGMEFYESRDREVQCDPISVSLDDEPKENSTKHLSKQPGEEKRIVALGDKIRCLKIKYFGEDPLDSPFFKEDELKRQAKTPDLPKEGLKFHSSYEYQPNKTMKIFVEEKLNDSNVEGTQENFNYQEIPLQPLPIQPQLHNATEEDFRVIPVREFPEITTAAPIIMGMRPPPMSYRPLPLSIIRLPRRPKPQRVMKTIKYKYNCLQPVTKMIISERKDGNEDIMFDCQDVKLIQTMRNGNPHFQIIPKQPMTRRSDFMDFLYEDSRDFPTGEVVEINSISPSRRKRSTPNTRRKSQLFPNKSLLDKIVRKPMAEKRQTSNRNPSTIDLGVKSPEEISDILTTKKTESAKTTSTTTTSSTTSTTPSSITSTTPAILKFERKTLPRLSGRDFLVRYHKTKGSKSSNKPDKEEFWKLKASTSRPPTTATPKPIDYYLALQAQETEKAETIETTTKAKAEKTFLRPKTVKVEDRIVRRISVDETEEDRPTKTKRDEPGPTPVLLYIVDQSTGRGQWIKEDSTTPAIPYSSTRKTNERQIKKQNVRKSFFTRKLKKVL